MGLYAGYLFVLLTCFFLLACLSPKVDRICTGREVVGNDIKVSAEPHVGEVGLTIASPCIAPY